MGVFKKLKDVLFDIEEEEIPVIKKEEVLPEKNPIKEIKIPKEEVVVPEPEVKKPSTFNFPLEFEDEMPTRANKKEYYFDDEFDIKPVKKEYKRFEEPIKKKSVPDYSRLSGRDIKKEDNKPFKPSPVISPVYGILNQNYSKDDVIVKSDVGVKNTSLDEALDKAHGVKPKKERIFDDEFEEPLKTLDEILISKDKVKEEDEELPIKKAAKKVITITEEESELDNTFEDKKTIAKEETTLEDDLFSLIDSMYEEKEIIDEE